MNQSYDIEDKRDADDTAWHARQVIEAEQALRAALRDEEFRLHFQPIIDIESKQIVGCEALVRWQHPQKGLLPPGEFIELAEGIGLIIDLGYWIARTACRFQKRLSQAVERPMFVTINLSGKQFEDPELISRLEEIIQYTQIDPGLIKYEITESLLIENPELANELLMKLKSTGARLAIDDFGTGYSSFSYLHQFPFDTLKIDRAFVSTMVPNRKSKRIVASLVNLSHDLGMDVVAEGIETDFEHEMLKKMGAEYGQGYFYSRPIDPDSFIDLLD
jgi:EAL domain-containing protein (putative c-di-GMP-specific phosphodiesterase class I)